MQCVVCLKNNASIPSFMCSYCGNVPAFRQDRNKVEDTFVKRFNALPYKKRIEIIKLANHRLNMIVKMNLAVYNSDHFDKVVEDFSLKYLIKEYVELAENGIELKMRLRRDPSKYQSYKYHQYVSPREP